MEKIISIIFASFSAAKNSSRVNHSQVGSLEHGEGFSDQWETTKRVSKLISVMGKGVDIVRATLYNFFVIKNSQIKFVAEVEKWTKSSCSPPAWIAHMKGKSRPIVPIPLLGTEMKAFEERSCRCHEIWEETEKKFDEIPPKKNPKVRQTTKRLISYYFID